MDFEDFMMEKHSEQYIGVKELMVDDFPEWCEGLSMDEWFKFGNEFAKKVLGKQNPKRG